MKALLILASALVLVSGLGEAAPPKQDLDWPCMQRYVPSLTAGMFRNDPVSPGDWHADPPVVTLVEAVAPRDVPVEVGESKIEAFMSTLPPADRAASAAEVFAGLVDETNRQRGDIVNSLRALTRREHGMSDVIAHVTDAMRSLPADADEATRDEVKQRRALLIRQFEETERTVRYACEVPVSMEGRLGQFSRALSRSSDPASDPAPSK